MTVPPDGTPPRRAWLRAAILVAIVYFVLGMLLLFVAGRVDPLHTRSVIRQVFTLAAVVVAIAHVRYEVVTLRSRPAIAALHVALAVAVIACVFAIKAVLHARSVSASSALLGASIVMWPVIAGGAAFLGTFAVASLWKKARP